MRIHYVNLAPVDNAERDSFNERNDCTVVALAVAVGMSYSEAHALLTKLGRKKCHGFTLRLWLDNQCSIARMHNRPFTIGDYKVERVRMDRPVTLAKFLRDFPRGRFICRKRGHVFVVDNGKVMNLWTGARTRISNLWYVTKLSGGTA